MRYCKHTQWLGLAIKDGAVHLQSTDRVRTLLDDLPDPDAQTPSLLVFIGNKAKSTAIRELVKTFSPPPRYGCETQQDEESNFKGHAKLNGRRGHGEIHLHIHSSSIFSSRPVLLAEGDLPMSDRQRGTLSPAGCHELTSRELPIRNLTSTTLSDAADKIYFRLLSPFADVFCFFAADVGGFRPIVHRLALWLDLGIPSTLPKVTHPRILIVVESSQNEDGSALRAFTQMLRDETTRDISNQFSGISLIQILPRKDVSDRARHRKLKEELLNSSDQVREARKDTKTLFSACHFAAFFRHAYNHLITSSVAPFNFIIASRIGNPVAQDLEKHFSNFLSKIKTTERVINFAIPVIASSLLLDSYPPDMHREQTRDFGNNQTNSCIRLQPCRCFPDAL